MGLDVIFVRNNNEDDVISWDDPIVQKKNGFPFERYGVPIYEDRNEYDEIVNEASTQWCIAEICGMTCVGFVSFRGRGYSHFAGEKLPYSFHHSFSPGELKEQATALMAWLETHHGEPDNAEYSGESLATVRHLSTLLNWAVGYELGTYASY